MMSPIRVHTDYSNNSSLGLSPEWITGGFSAITNFIGGSQAKKQQERQLEMLRLQQEIQQESSNAMLEAERLRLQAAHLKANNNSLIMNDNQENNDSRNNLLIALGVLTVLGLGAYIVTSNDTNDEPKALNGLVESLE